MTPLDVRIGSMIAGYRIDGLLGRGGMGVVYRAEHLRLHRPVALKLLAPEIAEDERFRARFLRESELAASIDHPNIIPIYDAGEEQGLLFIAMRHVGGTDLRTLLRETGRLPPERALSIIRQIAGALDHAHAHGLVHRDVKPGNILVVSDPADHCYLCDFGLTKSANSIADPASSGHLAGTVDYVAPEQITGAGADARSDLYSLACVAWECLTGEPPFRRESDLATLWAHVNDAPPSIDPALGLPPAVDAVLQRGLSKRSADRQDTSRQLAAGLADAVVGVTEPIATAPPPSAPSGPRSKTAVGAIAAILAIAAVAGLAWWSSSRPSASPPPAPAKRVPKPVPNAIVRIDPATRKLTTISLGGRPSQMLATAAGLWVADEGARKLWLIDPNTGDPKATTQLDGTPTDLAADGTSVWVAEGAKHELERFDDAGTQIGHLTLESSDVCCSGPLLVAASGDTVWIGSNGLVSKVDPNTGVVSPPEDVGVLPRAVDMETVPRGDGVKEALWTADGWSKVFKVRPSGAAKAIPVLVSATVGARPTAIATDSRHLWVAALGSKALYRIGLAGSPDLGPPIVLGDPPTSLAIDGRFVWVASSSTGRIWRIDSTTGKVMSPPIEVHLRINGIAVAGRSVWVTTGGQLGSAPPTGAVAYQGRGAVHIAGPGIGGAKTIQEASMPAWSPDGMHIAYVLQKALYVANWDGSDPVVLFGGDNEPVSAPAWSADGTQIAFVSSYGGTPDIRTIGADGSNPLTCEAASPTDNTSVESYPAYSPDGKTIAFLSDRNGARAVFTANSDCSGEASAVLPDAVSNMGAPAWSPDGTVLAFWNKDNNAIVVANPSNHGAYNVTDLKVTTLDPVRVSWSPDGRLIAFSAPAVGGGHTVYVMYADGNGRHPLTRLDNAQNPAWRPLRR